MPHTVFIDDSGDKKYLDTCNFTSITNPELKSWEFWKNNYFVMLALIINNENIPKIHRSVRKRKIKYFNDPDVEIKSSWLRIPEECKKHYLDKYSITEEKLNEFVQKIYKIFNLYKEDIKLIAVVFDKRFYKNRSQHNPYHDTAHVLFEKIESYMKRINSSCVLVVDQMEDSLSITRGRNKELCDVLLNNIKMRTSFLNTFMLIKDIEFRESSRENLLQLTDLATYNTYRQFVDYGREWEEPTSKNGLSLYDYFAFHSDNFVSRRGRIQGIGISKLPDISKRKWGFYNK